MLKDEHENILLLQQISHHYFPMVQNISWAQHPNFHPFSSFLQLQLCFSLGNCITFPFNFRAPFNFAPLIYALPIFHFPHPIIFTHPKLSWFSFLFSIFCWFEGFSKVFANALVLLSCGKITPGAYLNPPFINSLLLFFFRSKFIRYNSLLVKKRNS